MRDPFAACLGQNSVHSCRISIRRCSPQERLELQHRATIPKVPEMSLSTSEELDFPALPQLSPRVSSHTTVARVTALWESLVGMPHVKSSRESHICHDSLDGKREIAATAQEESARACPFSRRGLTSLGRLKNYPNIHFSTGEEASGSGPDSTQPLRPRHQRECNPRRPPNKSYGDWPVLRSPERVP